MKKKIEKKMSIMLYVIMMASVFALVVNVGVQMKDTTFEGNEDVESDLPPSDEFAGITPEDAVMKEPLQELYFDDWIVSDEVIIENSQISVAGKIVVTPTGSLILKNVELVCNDVLIKEGGYFNIDPSLIIQTGDLYIDGTYILDATTLKMDNSYDGEYGIQVNATGTMKIWNGSIVTAVNTDYEFWFEVLSGATFEMKDSELHECGWNWPWGGLAIWTDNVNIENNVITDNFYGIFLRSSWNYIANNNVSNNARGIYVYLGASYNLIQDNIWSNNAGTGISMGYSSTNNVIKNNEVSHNTYGISMGYSSNNNLITGNTISSNSDKGIYIHSYSNGTTVVNNLIFQNNYGVYLEDSAGNLIYHNNFVDNSVQTFDGLAPFNDWHHTGLEEGNFWSDYTGLDDGSGAGKHAIAGDFIGDTDIPHQGLDFDFYPFTIGTGWDMIFVDDDYTGFEPGFGTSKFKVIQNAVNYAWGGANIYIFNGTYNENVIVNKILYFFGDSVGASLGGDLTIASGGHLFLMGFTLKMNSTTMGEFGIYANNGGGLLIFEYVGTPSVVTNGYNSSAYYTFQVRDGSNFELIGSEVNNAGFAENLPDYSWAGLWINTDNVLIHDSVIRNNHFHGLILFNSSGHQIINTSIYDNDRRGIWGMNTHNNLISDNDIYGNNWGGISLSNLTGTVITGNNITSNGWNGISVSSGTVITGNIVSNNANDGIVVSNSPGSSIIANIVNDNGDDGIYISNSPNSVITDNVAQFNDEAVDIGTGLVVLDSDNCQIEYNLLELNWRGMYLEDSDNCDIKHNTVIDNNWHGIQLYHSYSSSIIDNNASENGGTGISAPSVLFLTLNHANDNGNDGISISSSPGIAVHDNLGMDNGDDGIIISSSPGITVQNNDVSDNGGDGLTVSSSSGSTLMDNIAISSGHWGIRLSSSPGSLIQYNTANNSGHGIYVGSSAGTTVDTNYANSCGDDGIYVSSSSFSIVTNNNANHNNVAVDIGTGITAMSSSWVQIADNYANHNYRGMYIENSHNIIINNNEVNFNNWYGIHLSFSHHSQITSNQVTFNTGEWDSLGILLSDSDNGTISSNQIDSNYNGAKLWYSYDSTISNNDVNSNSRFGVSLEHSGRLTKNPLIFDNQVHSNGGSGISLSRSDYVEIYQNNATFNAYGISLSTSHNVLIFDNFANANSYGIYLAGSNHNTIYENFAERMSGSGRYGIYLTSSDHNDIYNNSAKYNYFGISLWWGSNNNEIYTNDARDCIDYGAYLFRVNDNIIRQNEFKSSDSVGIYLEHSDNNDLVENHVISATNYGISLFESDLNEIEGNDVTGSQDVGIQLSSSNENTISNNTAELCDIGLLLRWSLQNNIYTNLFDNNNNVGVDLSLSNNNIITDNLVNHNPNYGIHLFSSNDNEVTNNDVNYNGIGIYLDWSENNIIITNTATFNDLIGIALFWSSDGNTINNNDASSNLNESIRIAYSDYNHVENNQAHGSIVGIHIDWSNNNDILNNDATNNVVGITVEWFSDHNIVLNNDVYDGVIGISVEWSGWNLIENNDARNNNVSIMLEWYSHNNTVTNNIATFSEFGIYLDWFSDDNTISFNNASENLVNGITLEKSDGNNVHNNTVMNNNVGLKLTTAFYNVIVDNLFSGNIIGIFVDPSNYNIFHDNMIRDNELGLRSEGSLGNVFYHNNFAENIISATDDQPDTNNWFHAGMSVGNYWSDYAGEDDGSGLGKHSIAGDGIGDTQLPYPGPNFDDYPYVVENAWITGIPRAPYASANGPYIVGEGSAVNFDASDSYDLDGDPIQYRWDTDGDGIWDTAWSSSPYASQTWYDDYIGIAIVEVSDGVLSDTHWTDVTVNNVAPTANFNNNGPKDEGSAVSFSFTSQYDPGTSDTVFTYSFDWDNDGTYEIVDQSSSSATHTWYDNGVITVGGRIKDKDGGYTEYTTSVTVNNVAPSVDAGSDQATDEGDTVSFSGSYTDFGSLDTHTIEWDFDYDGMTFTVDYSGSLTPITVFTDNGIFTVALRVTDDDGGIGLDTLTVTVSNVNPTAFATVDQNPVDEGVLVSFTGSQMDPGADDTFTYYWDFGDSGTSTLQNPTHAYVDHGPFTVYFTVTDDDGGSDTTSLIMFVYDLAPTADAGSDRTVTIIDVVTFDGSGSSSPSDLIVSYEWDFGDGSGASGMIVTHTYTEVGTYTATLTVMDDDGSIDTDTAIITVLAPGVDLTSGMPIFSPVSPVDIGATVTVTSEISNFGSTDAASVIVRFYDGDPDENGDGAPDMGAVQIGSDVVFSSIDSQQTVVASETWSSTLGYHDIYVWADPDDSVPEYDDTNNQAFGMIIAGPDLVPDNLIFTPASPVGVGDSVTLSVDVTNEGGTTVTSVVVRFYEEYPDGNGDGFEDPSAVQIGDVTIPSLGPGVTVTVSMTWSPSSVGNYDLSVWVDPASHPSHEGLILEAIETNNIATDVMRVGPDLALDFTDISFSVNPATEGTTVTITAEIHNYGGQDASDIVVNFYDDEIKKKALIGTVTIPNLAAGSSVTVSVTFDTTGEAGYHDIWVVVDPKDNIEEYDEANNQAYNVLSVI